MYGFPIAQHPTDRILHDYGLGKLGDPAASAVDSHLEACEACQRRVAELSGDSFLSRLRDAGARPDTPAPGPAPAGGAKKTDSPSDPASVPSHDPDLARSLPPELADSRQYQMLRELGRGGMGVVYLARNQLMNRLEALKILNKEMLERTGMYDRFLREVRAAARLAHPNVVGAYSAVQVGHLLVFAMEYVEGADLAQLVKLRGPRPVAHACSFAAQAAARTSAARGQMSTARQSAGQLDADASGAAGHRQDPRLWAGEGLERESDRRWSDARGSDAAHLGLIAPEQTVDA